MLNIQNVKVPLNSFYNVDNYWYDGISGYATGYLQGSFLNGNQFQYRFATSTGGLTTGITFQRGVFQTKNPFGGPLFLGGGGGIFGFDPLQLPIVNRGYVSGYAPSIGQSCIPTGTGRILPGSNGGIFNDSIASGASAGVYFSPRIPLIKSGYSGMGVECSRYALSFVGGSGWGYNAAGSGASPGGLGYGSGSSFCTTAQYAGSTLEIRFKKYGFWTPSGIDTTTSNVREALYINQINPYVNTNDGQGTQCYNVAIASKTGDLADTLSVMYGNFFSGGHYHQIEVLPSTTVINTNVWYTLSLVSTNNGMSLYYNGVLDCSNSYTGYQIPTLLNAFNTSNGTSNNPSNIAWFGGGYSPSAGYFGFNQLPNSPFNGIIDEIRGWDYPRSSGQIFSGYNKTINQAVESGLAIYMRM